MAGESPQGPFHLLWDQVAWKLVQVGIVVGVGGRKGGAKAWGGKHWLCKEGSKNGCGSLAWPKLFWAEAEPEPGRGRLD